MKIETKYSIGDEVVFNKNVDEGKYITCPFCKGKTSIIVEGTEIECQNCEDGSYYLWKIQKKNVTGLIKGIDIYMREGNEVSIRYHIKDQNCICEEDIIEK